VIEGGEGSGKSTLIALMKEKYGDKKFAFTREPGGSPYAEAIRDIALRHNLAKEASAETLFGLMWAARHDNLQKSIIPALNSGRHVISDRFDSATYAYQIKAMNAQHLENLFWSVRESFLKDCKPDLYIILDLDPKVGMERVSSRKEVKNHFDERKMDFHKKIRQSLLDFSKKVPSVIVDASQSLEKVKEDFFKVIDEQI
ncbi:MAG: dTMP kinase, partial [bacterium]